MAEPVIVATARSPIGRAFKGSLVDVRPDDLLTQVIQALLDDAPSLDATGIDDLYVGAWEQSGEQAENLARRVAVQLGFDRLPAVMVNRACASSVQTARMAANAIRAGDGDVFISAGVESISRYVQQTAVGSGDVGRQNPMFTAAQEVSRGYIESNEVWHDPRSEGQLPDIYLTMGQTAEHVATYCDVSRADQDAFALLSQQRAAESVKDGFFAAEITPIMRPDGSAATVDDSPRPGTTLDRLAELKPVFRVNGTVTAGNACPLNDGAAAVLIMSDTRAAELGLTPLARIVSTAATALSPEIMGLGPIEATRKALAKAGMDDRRRRPVRAQRGVRRPGRALLPRARHRRRPAQRARRRDRARPPLRFHRRPHHDHADPWPAARRQADRRRDHVRRRRPGHGHRARTPELTRLFQPPRRDRSSRGDWKWSRQRLKWSRKDSGQVLSIRLI